jgi:hypothetical protein
MICTECNRPAIKKEVIRFKKYPNYVEYTHAPDAIIGRFALTKKCLVIFPTKEELES